MTAFRGITKSTTEHLGAAQFNRLPPPAKRQAPRFLAAVCTPAVSQYGKAPKTLAGKAIGLLTTEGTDADFLEKLRATAKQEGAMVKVIAPKVGTMQDSKGDEITPDDFLAGAPSALFDCVLVAPSEKMADSLMDMAAAVDWVRMAYGHLKVIGFTKAAEQLLSKAGVERDDDAAVIDVSGAMFDDFVAQAKKHRYWEREARVRPMV